MQSFSNIVNRMLKTQVLVVLVVDNTITHAEHNIEKSVSTVSSTVIVKSQNCIKFLLLCSTFGTQQD